MTIFDYLQDILIDKRGDLSLEQYSPYIVTRWLSFLSPEIAKVLNNVNFQLIVENKEMHYKLMLSTFPCLKKLPHFNYIKKIKEKLKEEDSTELIASSNEISKRELKELQKMLLCCYNSSN